MHENRQVEWGCLTMIRYYQIVKKFFSLQVSDKKLLIFLFVTAFARSTTVLTLPYFASQIIEYATKQDYYMTGIMICILGGCFLIYNISHHLNYVAYNLFANATHNALQTGIMKKVSTMDENYAKDMSSSFLINTAFNDVGKVMQIPDYLFDAITQFISIVVSVIILLQVNIFIGTITLGLELLNLYGISKNMKKREEYLAGQRGAQDRIVSLFGQVIDGNKEVKAFNMEEDLNKHLNVIKRNWNKNYLKKRKYNDRAEILCPMLVGMGKIAIYAILIEMMRKGMASVSSFVLVIGYVDEVISKGKLFYKKINNLSSNAVRVDRIYQVLNYSTKNMIEFGKNATDDIIDRKSVV